LKYSPNSDKLAVGSHDHQIYIYEVQGNSYKHISTCLGHNDSVTSIDWSINGRYIQSNCGAFEYLFFEAQNGNKLNNGSTALRDEQWATYTVKLGWWVQGIFPRETSSDHVNAVDRSNGNDMIITGDDWGFVNLYRNPAIKNAKCKSYRAHSSQVVRVLFDRNDRHIYSVGGSDKTMMMW
jgi:WD40 repeat protein